MAQTILCADGDHDGCSGACATWYAKPGDEVVEIFTHSGGDPGVLVRCGCDCHMTNAQVLEEAHACG